MSDIYRGNGTDTHYVYDIKGRLSSLVTYTETNAQVKKLQDVSYTFKIDNSIAGVTNTPNIDTEGAYVSAVSYNYKYDGLNRLVKAEGMYSRATAPNSGTLETVKQFETGWTYAPNGNMTGKDIFDPVSHGLQDSLEYTYGANNHAVTSITSRLTSEEKYAMQYDACGNMTSQTSPQPPPGQGPDSPLAGGAIGAPKAMQYDSYNRITAVTNTDTSEVVGQYWYDDQGFRVRKLAKRSVSGEDRTVEVLYPSMYFGLEKQKLADGSEVPNSVYSVNNIYLDGVRIAAVIPSGDARYYLTDQVDSVKVVADDNGLPVSRMEYMPYGETWFQEGDTNNAPKYNSQELDTESNFYYYNARHYSQEIARFVTADTVIDGEFDTQGWNRYAYTKGNPIRYKDPSGHDSILVVSNEIMEENKNDDGISNGPHQGEKYNTYKGYIYKDTKILFGLVTLKTAKEKYLKDAANGNRANAEETVLEITRNTQGEKNYDTNGSMPPTGKNKEYEVRLGTPSSNIDKYRIGDPKYWPKDKEDKKKNAENYIKNPEKKGKRGWFNFDPWQNPGDLKGCLGISREDGKSFSEGIDRDDPKRTEKIFKKLNNYLEKVIPDLKEVNKNEGGEKVSVMVEDLFKKEK